jgi:hypothetical protein
MPTYTVIRVYTFYPVLYPQKKMLNQKIKFRSFCVALGQRLLCLVVLLVVVGDGSVMDIRDYSADVWGIMKSHLPLGSVCLDQVGVQRSTVPAQ